MWGSPLRNWYPPAPPGLPCMGGRVGAGGTARQEDTPIAHNCGRARNWNGSRPPLARQRLPLRLRAAVHAARTRPDRGHVGAHLADVPAPLTPFLVHLPHFLPPVPCFLPQLAHAL